ncbi:MAG TPA: hypothetical protein VHA52_11515, partial [Candidatus Babeliaceae bacterium]|nr:hypothetical protein [Candidatus Babeliaceae bacterium]
MNPAIFIYRLKAVIIACILGLSAITIKVFQLQVKESLFFLTRAQRNFLRAEKISSTRGRILDSMGRPLATNRPITILYWKPSGKKQLDPSQLYLINSLKNLFGLIIDEKSIAIAERKGKCLTLIRDISHDALSKLLEQFPNNINIGFDTTFRRFYPQATTASHLVGYLGSLQSNATGQMGLEKILEDILKGSPGELMIMVDSKNRAFGKEEIQKAL